MCSFTPNMYNHITLQTKGSTIDLAVEESYNTVFKERKFQILQCRMQILLTRKGNKENQVNLTRCIFTYVTPGNVARASQPNTYVATSKLVTRMNLSCQLAEVHKKVHIFYGIQVRKTNQESALSMSNFVCTCKSKKIVEIFVTPAYNSYAGSFKHEV